MLRFVFLYFTILKWFNCVYFLNNDQGYIICSGCKIFICIYYFIKKCTKTTYWNTNKLFFYDYLGCLKKNIIGGGNVLNLK